MSLIDALLLEPYPFESWITCRPEKGSGTLNDPYGVVTADDFDGLMNTLPANSRIHLGPGTFCTKGYSEKIAGGWQIQPGTRITGSGVDVTTLELVDRGAVSARVFAIGHALTTGTPLHANLVDFCEVSDMTIDCDLDSQTAAVAAGAIKVYGRHVRIRRVRAIRFGTESHGRQGVAIATGGAFPANPEPFDCVVEDCVIEQPFAGNVRETACISFAGGESATAGVMAFHRGCVVRNCLIDKIAAMEERLTQLRQAVGT